MQILLYRGKSLISKAIRFQTRSPYSHVAVRLKDGSVVEAWHVGGVRRLHSPNQGHTPGTPIDVFGIHSSCDYDDVAVEAFLLAQIGKRYDFRSVARFISRREAPLNDSWFCSELCLAAFGVGGLPLLRINPAVASPRDVSISPHLYLKETIT